MDDLHWASYVGMVTGIIGAITGIAGGVMGFLSLRKVKQNKLMDLRLELQKDTKSATLALHKVKALHEKALPSRKQILHERGMLGSSQWTEFEDRHAEDVARIEKLWGPIPEYCIDYTRLDEEKLERHLVTIHATSEDAAVMIRWYEEQLADDARWHELLRDERKHRESMDASLPDVIVPPKISG